MIVGALVWDSPSRSRLVDAARGQAHLRFCESKSELMALVENGLAEVVVLDSRDRMGQSTLSTVRRLREEFPSVPVVLYCVLTPSVSREMLEFARAGVSELILRGLDDVWTTLRAVLTRAGDKSSVKSLLAELEGLVPANLTAMMRFCLENGERPLTVEDVARALNVHRKTLVERLSGAGLPTPSSIIAWCRLLVVARMLEDPGRTAEQVALILNFPSSTALRNMIKRYTGLRTSEIRQNGGVRCVLHGFKLALAPRPQSRFVT
ncbi:MAG: helix-turn-helix domain-containing protein [Gemmatimonadota bacterium]